LDQILGHVYRMRIGPDYSMKILDRIRIVKISDLFNTMAEMITIWFDGWISDRIIQSANRIVETRQPVLSLMVFLLSRKI